MSRRQKAVYRKIIFKIFRIITALDPSQKLNKNISLLK